MTKKGKMQEEELDIAFSYEKNPSADSTLPPSTSPLKGTTGLLLKPEKVRVETCN
jgi:hypothetical protein